MTRRIFLLLLFCGPTAMASPAGNASIDKILLLPETKIDVGIAALTFGKEIEPSVDISAYSVRIDALVEKVRSLAKGSRDPDYRVRCLNTVLLLNEGFQGTRDSRSATDPRKFYLHELLNTKRGNCFSMPLLYVAVAQRLGWPVYMVGVPDHFFVRYVDPAFSQPNIETTSNGGYAPDVDYARDFRVSEKGKASGAYLRPLSYRETLAELISVNAVTLGNRGQMEKAIAYLKHATCLNPQLAPAWQNLSVAYRYQAKHTTGDAADEYLALAAQCAKTRDALGFVHSKDVPPFSSSGRPSP